MATSITYDGVPSAEGGNIFRDMSFWVAQRVPMRKTYVEMIENNGGTVVPLEKNADMLIADCARPKVAPAGSYSWKFIEESVKNGIVQLKDRYLIGRDPDLPRPVASGGLTRSTRTPFTAADDAAVAKWVLSHSVDRTGNKIFQEFELLNPRHTWQSWRNRYVKNLMLLPMEQLQRLAASAPVDEPQNQTSNGKPAAKPAQTAPPKHADLPSLRPEKRLTASTSVVEPQRRTSHAKPAAKPVQIAPPKRANPPPSGLEQRPAKRISEAQSKPQIRSPPGKTIQVETRKDPKPQQKQSIPESPPEASQESEDDQVVSQFQRDFTDFMQFQGREARIHHRIGSKKISLLNLLQIVEGQNVPPEEVDWIKVGEELGYDWSETQDVVAQLRQCYEENLLPFLDAVNDFSSDDGSDEEGKDDGVDEPLDGAAATLPNRSRSHSEVPSSPPAEFTRGKRPLDTTLDISAANPVKRRRVNQDVEIPSTPEEMTFGNNVHQQSPSLRRSLLQHGYVPDSEASQHLPPLPRSEPTAMEPATQDYRTQQTQPSTELLTRQESFDVTPSQQLRSEDLDATAIPFVLDPGRREQSTSSDEALPPSAQQNQTETGPVTKTLGSAAVGMHEGPTLSQSKPAKTSRRSLPTSFMSTVPKPAATNGSRSRPPVETRTKQANINSSNLKKIQDCVEHYESLGISNKIAVEALKRTTMVPGHLATLVIESLQQGNGIPSHHEGIWTDRDDKGLQMVTSLDLNQQPRDPQHAQQLRKAKKEHARLVNKHGVSRMELRRIFLEAELASDDGGLQG